MHDAPQPADGEHGVVEMTTYKYADGTPVYGEYAFVTDTDFFEEDSEPREIVRQRWVCVEEKVLIRLPSAYTCEVEDEEPCEKDATGWWRSPDGVWLAACAEHHGTQEEDWTDA